MSIQCSKDSLFNKWCWENWTSTCKKMKLDHQLIPLTRINSKWIKDLNVSYDTIKIIEENIGNKTSDILCSNIFADIISQGKETKEKISQWDYIKSESFCTARETISKMKRDPTVWENIFANDTSEKGLISKIHDYKEFIQLNTRKIRNPII